MVSTSSAARAGRRQQLRGGACLGGGLVAKRQQPRDFRGLR